MSDSKDSVQRAAEWLDDKLFPVLGPPPTGPYEPNENEDPHPGDADEICPVCRQALSRHTEEVEPGTGHVFRRCPDGEVIETQHVVNEPGPGTGPVLS